jgi:hypothetical protein
MRATSAILAGLLVFAAASNTAPPARAAQGEERPIPKSVFQKNADGSALHLQSQLHCPAASERFRLTAMMVFDGYGLDVDCNYDDGRGSVITMYVTLRQGATLQEHFDAATAAIKQRWPQVTPFSDTVPAPSSSAWMSALYVKDDTNDRSGVWVADFAGWTFKFRATYPAGKDDATFASLRELTAEAERSARAHLEACAKSPPPQRGPASLIEDTKELSALTLAALISESVGAIELKPGLTLRNARDGNAAAPIWCVERSVRIGDNPFLIWRNIAPGSPAADRVSLMTVGPAPAFDIVSDPHLTKIMTELAQKGGGTRPAEAGVYVVKEVRGTETRLFALFNGRPDADMAARLVNDILDNKRGLLGSFNAATKTISIVP